MEVILVSAKPWACARDTHTERDLPESFSFAVSLLFINLHCQSRWWSFGNRETQVFPHLERIIATATKLSEVMILSFTSWFSGLVIASFGFWINPGHIFHSYPGKLILRMWALVNLISSYCKSFVGRGSGGEARGGAWGELDLRVGTRERKRGTTVGYNAMQPILRCNHFLQGNRFPVV